jgi:DNA-binding CsgD family transcriptional regulator
LRYAPTRKLRNAQRIAGTWLTARQRDVIRLYATGSTRAEVMSRLGLTSATIDSHLRRARHRTGARTLYQLVAMIAAEPRERGRPSNRHSIAAGRES